MFVQFIEGPVDDPEALRRQHDRWIADVSGGAEGYLGSTGGVTEDGVGFLGARFTSAEAAAANADRPEQDAWWRETEPCFTGPVTFTDCDRVETVLGGGSDDAGFVQVIRGRVDDPDRALALLRDLEADLRQHRPDIIGAYVGARADGTFAEVVYFSSEDAAREGEQRETEVSRRVDEQFAAVQVEPPRFLDLRDPWLHTGG